MINEPPSREERKILCPTIRKHNYVKAVKGSIFSPSLFQVSLLLRKSWCIGKRAEAAFHVRKTCNQCPVNVCLPGVYGRKWGLMAFSALIAILSLQWEKSVVQTTKIHIQFCYSLNVLGKEKRTQLLNSSKQEMKLKMIIRFLLSLHLHEFLLSGCS